MYLSIVSVVVVVVVVVVLLLLLLLLLLLPHILSYTHSPLFTYTYTLTHECKQINSINVYVSECSTVCIGTWL